MNTENILEAFQGPRPEKKKEELQGPPISEVIKTLQEAMDKYGDLPCLLVGSYTELDYHGYEYTVQTAPSPVAGVKNVGRAAIIY